jgi:glycosyltransferase involved in cell wall biosynthesis
MRGPIAPNKTIAFVSNSAWSVYNFRLDVIRWLRKNDVKVLVFAPTDEYADKLTTHGCTFIEINFNNRDENPLKDYLFYRQLRKLYRQYKPDFIFHYVAKPNIYGSMAAKAEHIPSVAVITGLGYPFAKRNILFRIMRFLYRKALRHTREVWFLNNDDAKVFINENIVAIDRMKVLPGEGVNTRHFAPSSAHLHNETFRFVMSTRLLKSKGIGLYADAARILKKKNYQVNFSLIGFFENNHPDSISPENLKKWEEEGLIKYHGFADDVRPFLQNADCMVFPSFYNEGVPRCLMEAASMEIPAITSFNRGCKEVVLNNSNGYVCNPNDPFDLADKMEKMINTSADDRRRMGKNGRQLVLKKFDICKIIEEYSNTLISAFESPGDLHPIPERRKTPDENNHGSNSQHGSAAQDNRGRI